MTYTFLSGVFLTFLLSTPATMPLVQSGPCVVMLVEHEAVVMIPSSSPCPSPRELLEIAATRSGKTTVVERPERTEAPAADETDTCASAPDCEHIKP